LPGNVAKKKHTQGIHAACARQPIFGLPAALPVHCSMEDDLLSLRVYVTLYLHVCCATIKRHWDWGDTGFLHQRYCTGQEAS